MAETLRPLYRSSGKPGYSGWMELQPGRIWARKFERAVQVRFADSDCSVRTREGVVSAHRGDAILTGVLGEQWRVSRARFADKYRPDGALREAAASLDVAVPAVRALHDVQRWRDWIAQAAREAHVG